MNGIREVARALQSLLMTTSILTLLYHTAHADAVVQLEVRPSSVDGRVHDFDEFNYVTYKDTDLSGRPLVVFLPGTNGKPDNLRMLLNNIETFDFPVVGLEYNNSPAVAQICPEDPSPECAAEFRRMRTFGGASSSPVFNKNYETVTARLHSLLSYLVESDERWRRYLKEDGINWQNIIISGFSQGAGMAAYIAKQEMVERVVLFSGPWDFVRPEEKPAPWLYQAGRTPNLRWFGAYHVKERTVRQIRGAYTALGIPNDHLIVFDHNIPSTIVPEVKNPYHVSTVRDPSNIDAWRALYLGGPKQ